MMRSFIAGFIFLFSSSFIPLPALAAGTATLGFSSQNVSVAAGESFDVIVTFQANKQSIDTVRSFISFDPAVLSVSSITLVGPFNRNAPANFFDNENGKISWGAFTLDGPVETSGLFSKITFVGKQAGQSKLTFEKESKMISGGEEKIDVSSLTSATITVESATETDPSLAVITINSPTHHTESDWYSNDSVELNWVVLEADSPITSYLYSFDESSNTEPSTRVPASQTSKTFKDVQDGVHYFHIKGVQKNGKTTKTVHYRVNVDQTKPNEIALTISEDQLLEGESLWLTFATTDETSGVVEYQVAINSSEFQTQTSPMELTDLKTGTYFLRVSALDRAGNVTYQGKSVRVYPVGTKIERSEGYNPNSEIEARSFSPLTPPSLLRPLSLLSPSQKLLITSVLLVLSAFGIIYAFKRKKIK